MAQVQSRVTLWRRRTVTAHGEQFTVVWDGRKGAPSLIGDHGGHENHTIERGTLNESAMSNGRPREDR
jgi:hypothetical protein